LVRVDRPATTRTRRGFLAEEEGLRSAVTSAPCPVCRFAATRPRRNGWFAVSEKRLAGAGQRSSTADIIEKDDTLVMVGKAGQYAAFRRMLDEGAAEAPAD
jgi:hypothetical protein